MEMSCRKCCWLESACFISFGLHSSDRQSNRSSKTFSVYPTAAIFSVVSGFAHPELPHVPSTTTHSYDSIISIIPAFRCSTDNLCFCDDDLCCLQLLLSHAVFIPVNVVLLICRFVQILIEGPDSFHLERCNALVHRLHWSCCFLADSFTNANTD